MVEGLNSRLAGRVRTRRKPLVLVKGVTPEELRARVRDLAKAVAAEGVRLTVEGLFVHEDCDAPEPAHKKVSSRIRVGLAKVGVPVHPVTPAFELEAWFLLWPSMLPKVRRSWRSPQNLRGTHVGLLRNAKERLVRELLPLDLPRSQRARFRTYRESDAPLIANVLRRAAVLRAPEARSDSYSLFVEMVDAIN